MWHRPQPVAPPVSEADELAWVIAISSGRGADFHLGANVRRRIHSRVTIVETDEGLGTLRRPADASVVLEKSASLTTGSEIIPFLDCVLLTVASNPKVLDFVAVSISSLTRIIQSIPLDRYAIARVLALAKLLDEEVIGKAVGLQDFISACQKLVDDTIDPIIRQHATEAATYLQATSTMFGITLKVLGRDELISFKKAGKLCLKCDTGDHVECSKTPSVCFNCRGNRLDCMRGCHSACRVCGEKHPDKSIIVCLDNAVAPKIQKRPAEEMHDDDLFSDEEKEAKKFRSVKDYRENKRKAKEVKKANPTETPVTAFEKLLKDTVARICFSKIGSHEDDGDLPEWRKVYRKISAILMDKETRVPETIRFRCKTPEEQKAVVKRVTEYTEDYLKKH